MKSPTLLLLFLFLSFCLSAQYERGGWYFDGGTSASVSRTHFPDANQGGQPGQAEHVNGGSFSSSRLGYLLVNRLLVGTRVRYSASSIQGDLISTIVRSQGYLNPFGRYYFLAPGNGKLSFFGELGFGTIGFGDDDGFETDFQVGVGAELGLRPGIIGSATLFYNASATGLNVTNFNVGLSVLTGQLADTGTATYLRAGTLTARNEVANLGFGYRRRGDEVDSYFGLTFSPTVGYFPLDGLLLEADLSTGYFRSTDEIDNTGFTTLTSSRLGLTLGLNVRYYPLGAGRVLPYVTAGSGYALTRNSTTIFNNDTEVTDRSVTWNAGLGASYFLSPYLALDATVGYWWVREEIQPASTPDIVFELPRNRLQLSAGFRFFLPAD